MTSVITSLDSIPNELNNLQSVSECDINMKSAEMSPMMPEDLSLHYSHAQLNIDWHQQGKRRKYVLDDNVDKASGVGGAKTKRPGSPTAPPMGKKKVYMLPPLEDPEYEKRRKNAIVAFRNRQLKKKQSQDLQDKVKALQDDNAHLQDISQQLDKDLRASHEEHRVMSSVIQKLEAEVMSLRSLFQQQQEKLAFVQEHLRLINGTMDEDDSTRKLLNALLERIPVSQPPLSSPHHIAITSPPRIISPPSIASPRNASPRLTTTSPRLTTTSPLHTHPPPLTPIPKSSRDS